MLPVRSLCQGSKLPTASPAPKAVHHLVLSSRYAATWVGKKVTLDLVWAPPVNEMATLFRSTELQSRKHRADPVDTPLTCQVDTPLLPQIDASRLPRADASEKLSANAPVALPEYPAQRFQVAELPALRFDVLRKPLVAALCASPADELPGSRSVRRGPGQTAPPAHTTHVIAQRSAPHWR